MKLQKHWKMGLILLAMSVQSMVFNWFMGSHFNSLDISIAGEVPEPGTILLFGLGALMLRHENKKQRKQQ